MKKRLYMTGKLLLPLQEGSHAVIIHNGALIYTSTVKQILKITEHCVSFETKNSIYKVSSVPETAYMARCA